MNNEDYVSLEVAKMLKEKGFNEYCGAYYHLNWENMTEEECFEVAANHDFRNKDNGYRVGAPTLYESQKWIRNNHNIHIVIDNYACGYAWFLYKADNGTRISEYAENGPNDGGCWDTYEEALNAGILEALKLI